MKVLFNSIANIRSLPPNMVSDYQSDMLFHGMRQLLGDDCIDVDRFWWMYKSDKEKRPEDFPKIWGSSFSIYGLLDDVIKHTGRQIQLESDDIVILPLHHTIVQNGRSITDNITHSLSLTDGKRIAIIDGWDRDYIDPNVLQLCRENNIAYFKRELYDDIDGVYPISFAIPKEKIWQSHQYLLRNKRKYDVAPLIPVNQSIDSSYMSTYIYDNEQDYYQMYRDSHFALTSRKGGWDTLRHYEIMANGSMPLFVDIDNCPKQCLWNFPKDLCRTALSLPEIQINLKNGKWIPGMKLPHCGVIDRHEPGKVIQPLSDKYYDLLRQFQHEINMNLTTEALASYVLGVINDTNR